MFTTVKVVFIIVVLLSCSSQDNCKTETRTADGGVENEIYAGDDTFVDLFPEEDVDASKRTPLDLSEYVCERNIILTDVKQNKPLTRIASRFNLEKLLLSEELDRDGDGTVDHRWIISYLEEDGEQKEKECWDKDANGTIDSERVRVFECRLVPHILGSFEVCNTIRMETDIEADGIVDNIYKVSYDELDHIKSEEWDEDGDGKMDQIWNVSYDTSDINETVPRPEKIEWDTNGDGAFDDCLFYSYLSDDHTQVDRDIDCDGDIDISLTRKRQGSDEEFVWYDQTGSVLAQFNDIDQDGDRRQEFDEDGDGVSDIIRFKTSYNDDSKGYVKVIEEDTDGDGSIDIRFVHSSHRSDDIKYTTQEEDSDADGIVEIRTTSIEPEENEEENSRYEYEIDLDDDGTIDRKCSRYFGTNFGEFVECDDDVDGTVDQKIEFTYSSYCLNYPEDRFNLYRWLDYDFIRKVNVERISIEEGLATERENSLVLIGCYDDFDYESANRFFDSGLAQVGCIR